MVGLSSNYNQMGKTITTFGTLERLIEIDTTVHKVKDLAELLLTAKNDWRTLDQKLISDFVTELKNYFGSPLTIKAIDSKRFDGKNDWELTAGSSIAEMIQLSTQFCNESDFDEILQNILSYYGEKLTSA